MKKVCICLILILSYISIEATEIKDFQSKAYILMEKDSKRVLLQKNGYQKNSIASLTKVLTSIVVLENANLKDEVEISAKSAGVGGSTVGVLKGDIAKVEDLMYSLLLCSGNDAAIALAEHIGGSVEGFSKMMNEKAKEIGAKDSHFVTPHGLDNDEHYSTCYDMALITSYALNNLKFREIINTKYKEVNLGSFTKSIKNTNRLLKNLPYATGVKTGFTNKANKCLIGSAKKEDMELIAVVLGNESTDSRFSECQKLLEYGMEKYKKVNLNNILKWYIKIDVIKGKKAKYVDYETAEMTYPLTEEERQNIEVVQDIEPVLYAPVNKGRILGKVSLLLNKEEIYSKDIILKENIDKKDIVYYFLQGIRNIFSIHIEF